MTVTPEWLPVFVAVGTAAGFLNTVAGGGSFFSFPLLILLGFPPQIANGTIRVSIVLQNLVAVPTYARGGFFFPRAALICSLVTVPAAVAGSFTAVSLDPEPFRHVSAVLVLLVLVTLFVKPSQWTRKDRLERIRWNRMLPLMAAVGFYGGFFQLGAGMPFLAVAVLAGGWDLVSANSLKVTVVLIFSAVALVVFASHGQVDWVAGGALGVGNMIGAWWGARSAVKRGPGWIRWIMVAMGVLAAVRMLFGNGPATAEAAPIDPPPAPRSVVGEFLVSAALHLHGPFSEGNASMEWHTDHAANLGVDVLWWTDHDWRLEGIWHTRAFDFETAVKVDSRTIEEADDALAGETRRWVRSGGIWANHEFDVSSDRASQGTRSLRLRANAPGDPFFHTVALAQESTRQRHRRPLMSRPRISFSLYPESLDPSDGKFFVEVTLSVHQEEWQSMRWVAGSQVGEPVATRELAYTEGEWNHYEFDVAAAAMAQFTSGGADSLRGLDNALYEVRIGFASRDDHLPLLYFDDYRVQWDDTATGLDMVGRQSTLADWYETVTPDVTQFVGTEISRWVPLGHLNAFTPTAFFPDYGTHGPTERLSWAVDQVHAVGGVVSLNHVYFPAVYWPDQTPQEKAARIAARKLDLIGTRALGADILEVGYRQRGGMSLVDFLDTWDAATANRLFITGNGVTDSHGTDLFVGWAPHQPSYNYENNFVTWLWVRERTRLGLIAALRSGRAFFGDPFRFSGTFDVCTDDGMPMGRVIVTDRDTETLHVTLEGAPEGATLRLLQFEIHEDAASPVLDTNVLRDEIVDPATPLTIDTSVASAVRLELHDAEGAFLISNPHHFLRRFPDEGIPAGRAGLRAGPLSVRTAENLTLDAVEWDDPARRVTLRARESAPGAGRLSLAIQGLGAPTSVTGVDRWSFAGDVLSLEGFRETRAHVVVSWEPGAPAVLELAGVRPNPFRNDATTVAFTLSPGGPVELDVMDVTGRRVARLLDRPLDAGTHEVTWNGRNARGGNVAAGVYFLRLRSGATERVAKLVKLR